MKKTVSGLLCLVMLAVSALCFAGASAEAAPAEDLRYADTQYINMYTSSPGGDMYNMAAAIAPFWDSELNVVASIGPGGSVSNYKAIANGECTIGFDHQCMHYWGERGEGPYDQVIDGVSYMAILFPATIQAFVSAKNTSINTLEDIKDKRIGIGAVGSLGARFVEDYLDTMFGINQQTVMAAGGTMSNMSDSEMSGALSDGIIDIAFQLGAYPKTSIQEIENTPGVRFIPLGEQLDAYLETNKGWTKFDIPANTYAGQTEPYTTATSWAIMSVSDKADEELIYRLTRVAWEHIEEEGEACSTIARFMKLEDTLAPMSAAKLHPGAERYYREIGLLN